MICLLQEIAKGTKYEREVDVVMEKYYEHLEWNASGGVPR